MKLVFAEQRPDYGRYLFPYTVWALPEQGERPSDMFAAGFLPAAADLTAFQLCRQVRVDLRQWQASSENRRIIRRCAGVTAQLVARPDFAYDDRRRAAYAAYAEATFGEGVMSRARLDALFASAMVSHVLTVRDETSGAELGAAMLYVEEESGVGGYWFAFYEPQERRRSLGMFMMTSAVALFAARSYRYLYLGTCYSRRALYKSQFRGVEFFNGFSWSSDLRELKYLIERGQTDAPTDLLEDAAFYASFHPAGLAGIAAASPFSLPAAPRVRR